MAYSKEYQDQEAKNEQKKVEKANEAIKDHTKIYWAKCSNHKIANFVPEIRATNGMITQHEQPLSFNEHILTTADPKKIEFIESSIGFGQGDVVLCKDMTDAVHRTQAVNAMKGVKTLHVDSSESVIINEAGSEIKRHAEDKVR